MLKNTLLTLLLLVAKFASGQDTTYYDQQGVTVPTLEQASTYKIVFHDQADTARATTVIYFRSGQKKWETHYANYKRKLQDGKELHWYESGQLKWEINLKDNQKHGLLYTYWPNGTRKRKEFYEKDILMGSKCMDTTGAEIKYFDFEKNPEFPGGREARLRYLDKELTYPMIARKQGQQGRVLVGFTVDEQGELSNFKILRGVSAELDEEALRVVRKMPKWTPGERDGEVVKILFTLPIRFELR